MSEQDNPLHRFEGQTVNMDEVNFFAKRMESLTEYERKVLSAYVSDYGVGTMQDLINLTFSMKGLSLITDFSDAEQVGKRLYMDEFLAMSEEEKEQTNFIQFAEKTLNEGKIKFNDVDMDTSGLICARKKIAYVEQETCFFKGTLIDNLIISGVDDKGKFIEIAKEFDLYDEIVQMPEMMNTQLTSGATNLSVGQRKRLYNYLQSIKKNKIIIVITHNNEEKDYFDKIIFLDKK